MVGISRTHVFFRLDELELFPLLLIGEVLSDTEQDKSSENIEINCFELIPTFV